MLSRFQYGQKKRGFIFCNKGVDFLYSVVICRYTLLRMRDLTASATALTRLVWAQRKEGRRGSGPDDARPPARMYIIVYKQCDATITGILSPLRSLLYSQKGL